MKSTSIRALFALAFLFVCAPSARAQDENSLPVPVVLPAQVRWDQSREKSFGVANSNCANCDTVWIGHSASGRGGTYLGVGVGGVWDFDQDIAGTDSTQGWRFYPMPAVASVPGRPPEQRLDWMIDTGNQINVGNTALWAARDLAGRKYVKTGVAGAWHADDLVGVKANIANGAEPSALPIAGSRSAWCGLRASGDMHAIDALTGNPLNSDLQTGSGLANTLGEWPGFCNLWDQMLYKDFVSTGTGTVAFRFRTDMSNLIDANGSGWFNPDPTSPANFVNNTADSFMVYVGSPNESVYDTNRRWFSEVLDLSRPWKELFATSAKVPVAGADTSVSKAYAGVVPVGGVVRVVFRIKTNRIRADQNTGSVSGFNSKDGAAVLDQVSVDGGAAYGFETPADVAARQLIPDLAVPGGAWATTGRPPSLYEHIHNTASLVYEDLCGAIGSPTRMCSLAGNVLLDGNHDQGERLEPEHNDIAESPTISLAVRTAPPGTKDAQGLDAETAQRVEGIIQFDFYPGFMPLSEGLFINWGARSYAPTVWKQPISGTPTWSNYYGTPFLQYWPTKFCYTVTYNLNQLGFPGGQADSVRLVLQTYTQTWRFGGSHTGVSNGTYFDNVRFGLVRDNSGNLDQAVADRWQDQFPVNEAVVPGDSPAFDTTSAHMTTSRQWYAGFQNMLVPGDSLVCTAAYGVGNGTSTGTRLDFVFRVDPGPGNYSVRGDRSSPLVNRDPGHPFFATYLANNGPFGTSGGHSGTWNRDVWNSARMDSAELNVYPVPNNTEIGPNGTSWMATLHEQDPNYATLAVLHPRCFLDNPGGCITCGSLTCDGTVPAIYGAASGTTREGTKILPDGWFTPGTHIEYFLRRSRLEAPTVATLLPDTSRVVPQGRNGNASFDLERWENVDVLPDLWKSTRFNGAGLACMLLVDRADRRGADPAFRGAADSLGLGKSDGATQGWHASSPAADPNDPSGFVAANRGQYGLNYDHFDGGSAGTSGGGAIGSRYGPPGTPAGKGDKAGPSLAMATAFYSTIAHYAGDLFYGSISDGYDSYEGASDIRLYRDFLNAATAATPRGLWLSGDNISEDAANQSNPYEFQPFLEDTLGARLFDENYKTLAGSSAGTVGFLPTAAWAHPGRVYGFNNLCIGSPDVLQLNTAVSGAAEAAQYQAFGPGPWTASVYRPREPGVREWRSLVDGFDLSHLRGTYTNVNEIGQYPETDFARIHWFDDAVNGLFQTCFRKAPLIGFGDVPGQGGNFANLNLGAAPNPALAGHPVLLRFSLARAQDVTIRIYTIGGREVARVRHAGAAGDNAVPWRGQLANGALASPGVYFYAIDAVGFASRGGRVSKLVLLPN